MAQFLNPSNPRVSIVILNWNGLKNTIDCLESLKRTKYPNYEVIIVDNGSKESEGEVLQKKYRRYIQVIRNSKNLGFAEGNNTAIRKVFKEKISDYILTLNNDITVEPDFLTELVKIAQEYPEAGSIQCKMVWTRDRKLLDNVGLKFLKPGLAFDRGRFEPVEDYNKEEEILGCCAGACLYKSQALEAIRIDDEYFDKDFFASYEDVDLALRLQWMGWKSWYCPKAIVYHQKGAAIGVNSNFLIYYNRRNKIWMRFKNLPFSFLLKNIHQFFLIDLSQAGLDLFKKTPTGIKGVCAAYFNLGKMLKKRKKIHKKVNFSEIEKFFISSWNFKTIREAKDYLAKKYKYEKIFYSN